MTPSVDVPTERDLRGVRNKMIGWSRAAGIDWLSTMVKNVSISGYLRTTCLKAFESSLVLNHLMVHFFYKFESV